MSTMQTRMMATAVPVPWGRGSVLQRRIMDAGQAASRHEKAELSFSRRR